MAAAAAEGRVEIIARVLRRGPPLSRSPEEEVGCAFLLLPVAAPEPTAAAVRPAPPRTTTTKTHTTTTTNDHHHHYATTRTRRRPRTTTTTTTPPTTTHRITSYMRYRHRRCDFRWGCELSTCLPAGEWEWVWESTAACRSDLGTALGRMEEEEEVQAGGWSSCEATRWRVRGVCCFRGSELEGGLLGVKSHGFTLFFPQGGGHVAPRSVLHRLHTIVVVRKHIQLLFSTNVSSARSRLNSWRLPSPKASLLRFCRSACLFGLPLAGSDL